MNKYISEKLDNIFNFMHFGNNTQNNFFNN